MKLVVNKSQLPHNPEQFLRRAGYGFIHDRRSGHDSFVRRLTRDHYPRLHMYVGQEDEVIVFNLHLDQKRPSYGGSHAHNAEYDSPVVKSEIDRLRGLLLPEEYDIFKEKPKEEEKGFWGKLFK